MATFSENKVTVVVVCALLLYFLWMDIALFYHVNNRSIAHHIIPEITSPSATVSVPQLISPFTGLSVKMMMMDPVNNYIFTPAAQIFNEITKFSSTFYFITPNMVSFIGVLFALGSAKAISMEYHIVAIVLFQVRTFCDALDGIVARNRLGLVQHVSIRNTSGYVVDGVADALGFAALLVGCFQYLCSAMSKHKFYLPLNTSDACKDGKDGVNGNGASSSSGSSSLITQRRVIYVVICFGLQMAIGAFFWDHYINAYHNLLESNAPTVVQTQAQDDILRSSITWILMWFWRLSNAHTFIQFLLFAIYINKLWEFLTWIQYIGFAQILTLAFFTELHLTTVRSYIMSFT